MTIKQFSQTDPQWKSNLLGFDKASTIGGYGCLLTSMTMCATHYGVTDLTPSTLNDKMKAVGGFQAGTAYLIAGAIGSIVPGMQMDYRNCAGSSAPLAEIDNHLAMNLPVIIEVDYSPATGLQTHYMVTYGKSGDDYLVYDPYPFPTANGQIKLSQSKYAQIAGSNDPGKIITGVFFTSGPTGPLIAPPAPNLDTGVHASFPVYASADGLALRSQALVADYTLLNRYAMNTQFTVLASDADANATVGQNNLWLAVKAPDDTQGYVAAWLVTKTQTAAAPAPGTPPAAVPAPINAPVVKTNVDGLKLRSKPDSSDATVLKAYPLGTELKCLEPASDVPHKVGVMYEWLDIVDIQGSQGVVAAWYVSMAGAAAFGPTNQPASQPVGSGTPDPNAPVILRALEDNLALRIAPVIMVQSTVCTLLLGTELISLDEPAVALPKIGNTNQWIHVRDVKGNEGYVAAWLVKVAPPNPALQSGPQDS
jgi:hypothetical protein